MDSRVIALMCNRVQIVQNNELLLSYLLMNINFPSEVCFTFCSSLDQLIVTRGKKLQKSTILL